MSPQPLGQIGSWVVELVLAPHADPLHDATLRYESTSRFTATVPDERGQPVLVVFQRQGLRWRLSDIRLDPATP